MTIYYLYIFNDFMIISIRVYLYILLLWVSKFSSSASMRSSWRNHSCHKVANGITFRTLVKLPFLSQTSFVSLTKWMKCSKEWKDNRHTPLSLKFLQVLLLKNGMICLSICLFHDWWTASHCFLQIIFFFLFQGVGIVAGWKLWNSGAGCFYFPIIFLFFFCFWFVL